MYVRHFLHQKKKLRKRLNFQRLGQSDARMNKKHCKVRKSYMASYKVACIRICVKKPQNFYEKLTFLGIVLEESCKKRVKKKLKRLLVLQQCICPKTPRGI